MVTKIFVFILVKSDLAVVQFDNGMLLTLVVIVKQEISAALLELFLLFRVSSFLLLSHTNLTCVKIDAAVTFDNLKKSSVFHRTHLKL